MNTARKVLSATMPTKNAAIHSMESMKRSMTFFSPSPGGGGSPLVQRAAGWGDLFIRSFTPPRLASHFVRCSPTLPLQGRVKRRNARALLNPRLELLQCGLQIGVDRGRVAAGFLHR